jgi:predicted DsbA family dithiol-disulfide isomerase
VRLDDVQEHFGDRIVIEWKSFMLRSTEAGRKSRDEFIAYTQNWARMPAADARLEVTAPWASDDEHPSHSLPALAGAKLAATYGSDVEDAFHRAMFKAYFAENRTISDTDVITAIALASGVDATEFADRYRAEESELGDQVISDHNDAVRLGINAVPTIIVDDRISIPGAQETATYIQVIEQLLRERETLDADPLDH